MIGVVDVTDHVGLDLFEEGLLLPVPGLEKNTIVLEARDGTNVQHLTTRGVTLAVDGKAVMRLRDVKIEVYITDARVALACSKYDKGGGWIGGAGAMIVLNSVSKARATVRRHGKMLVGQVRYPWLSLVGSTSKSGFGSDERLIFDCKQSKQRSLRLTLVLPNNVDAAKAAAEIVRRAATYRLATDTELGDEEREKLMALTTAQTLVLPPGAGKNQISFHQFPTFWWVGEKGARLTPGSTPTAVEGVA